MRYRLFGRSGLRVSELCLGTMTFGPEWGWGADKDTSHEIYRMFRDAGGTFIDTADRYTDGTSEEYLGDFIDGHREEVVLATKYTDGALSGETAHPNAAGNSRKRMTEAVEASLRRLNTDYIDLLWVHAWDFMTPVEEVMRGLDDLVRQGKVLYIGLSDAPAWVAARANTMAELRGWTPFTGLQIEYNLTERTPERDLLPMAQALSILPVAWSPLASGLLTGKYTQSSGDGAAPENGDAGESRRLDVAAFKERSDRNLAIARAVDEVASEVGRPSAQVAINWVRQKGVLPILGATKPRHMESNLAALAFTLGDEHLDRLDDASAIDLGFPHDFLTGTQAVTYGGFYDRIDADLHGAPLHWTAR